MFSHQKSKRGNETFVSSNPYIKFKKDNAEFLAANTTLRNQNRSANKKQQNKVNNNKLIQDVVQVKDGSQKGHVGEDRDGAQQHVVESGPESQHQQSVVGSAKAQPDAEAK